MSVVPTHREAMNGAPIVRAPLVRGLQEEVKSLSGHPALVYLLYSLSPLQLIAQHFEEWALGSQEFYFVRGLAADDAVVMIEWLADLSIDAQVASLAFALDDDFDDGVIAGHQRPLR